MTRRASARASYTAVYVPAGAPGWWTVRIREVPGVVSQGRGIAQARERIRVALSLAVRGATRAEIVDEVRLPPRARRAIAAYRRARGSAQAAQEIASARSREAIAVLVDDLGLSTRDASAALGVSQARIAQLAR